MTSKEIIQLTKQLIAIPSTADNPQARARAVEFVSDIVRKCPNVTVERFEQNGTHSFLAYKGQERPTKFDILLNGHVDVVAAQPEQFKPTVKNGRLYGRGALDMKGTALALTDVFCHMVNEVPYALGLQIVSDEETGGYDGVRLQLDDGVRANFVVMGEYANDKNTIYNAARGLCWAEIAFSGKSAHGGHLWNGTNAVMKAGDFAGAVLKRYPTPDKETWTTTASIANLSTPNETYNKVPDKAVLKIDFRFTQEDPVFQNRESLEDFIKSIDPDAQLVKTATFEPAVNVNTLNPYVQGMSSAMHKVTGKTPKFLGRPAGSDGRHFAMVNNDIVEFGLYGQGPHSDNEYVELDSFAEYHKTMCAFLRQPVPPGVQAQAPEAEHVKQLRKLVSMPTITGDLPEINKALAYVQDYLEARGMFVKRYERNGVRSIIANTNPENKRPKVLLNAHIDVVPGSEGMFKLNLKRGKYTGRGVMDMKHAVACYMALVDNLKDELDDYDFGIMINSDEEVGGNNGVRPLLNQEGYRADVVIVPDGGNNWEIERFCKGVSWIELTATGKSAHASRPWEGESAIKRLMGAVHEIEKLNPTNPGIEDSFLSVGTIKGGSTANQIPAHASAMLDIRTGSKEDQKHLQQQIISIAERHSVKAEVLVDDLPCVTDTEHPLVKPMVDIVTRITGSQHDTAYDLAVTDGRLFAQVDIPTIIINPECGDIHTEKEWMSETGFNQFYQAIEQYVRQMSPQPNKLPRSLEITRLTERLNKQAKPLYVWLANYGMGLHKQSFMHQIKGGTPEDSKHYFPGCTDKSDPLDDVFVSMPYEVYFTGQSRFWNNASYIQISPRQSPTAHTIMRMYKITMSQLEEIAAQNNDRTGATPLPYKKAILKGHATVGDGSGHYDEMVFCGTRDGLPIFTFTSLRPKELPHQAPAPIQAKLLCLGLSEKSGLGKTGAIDYLLTTPGITGNYNKQEIADIYNQATKPSKKQP